MICYLMGINILTFLVYGMDKNKAKNKKYRISEYHLLVLSFFGGCFGALLGMKVFHHKTKKVKFWILNFLFIIIWVIILFECKIV